MKLKPIFWIFLAAFFGAILYVQTVSYDYSGDDGIYAKFNRVTSKGMEEWPELFKYGSMNFIEIDPVNTSIYRPFTLLTFAVERQVFGEFNGRNGHTLNVLLYFILLLITGKILLRLFEQKGLPWFLPVIILALYAAHPVHTEVVASVKSRDSLLAAIFALWAISIWIKNEGKLDLIKNLLVGLLFFISLISKEESLPMIALVGLIAYFFQKKTFLESVMATIPFIIPTALYLAARGIILDDVSVSYNSIINSVLYGLDGGERLATNLFIYLQYIKLLFFPHPLSWDYSFSQISVQTFSNPVVWLSLIIIGGLIYVAFKGLKTRSLFSFGIIFYFASFSIFANLTTSLTIGSNLGERFLFIPSLAFCFLIVYGLFVLLQSRKIQKLPIVMVAVFAPVFLGFTWKTIDRSQVWESNMTLSKSGVETAPKSWRTHAMLGEELRLKGNEINKVSPDSAKTYFEEAVSEFDQMNLILGKNASVSQYNNALAEVLLNLGDSARAIPILEETIKKNPKAQFGWFKLAMIYFIKGDFEKAEEYYLNSLKTSKPEFFPTYKNLGLTYLRKGEDLNAIQMFEKALEFKEDPEINHNLAFLYTKVGNLENAKKYQTEGGISVKETGFLLALKAGNDAFEQKNFTEAIVQYKKCENDFQEFGGSEKYPLFFAAYGKALLESSDTLNAKSKFLKAYEADPKNSTVLTNLGTIAFMKERKYPDAEKYYREAIEAGAEDKFNAYSNLGMVQLIQRKEVQAAETFENALKYGTSKNIISNLYLINRSLGNKEKMEYYQKLLTQ